MNKIKGVFVNLMCLSVRKQGHDLKGKLIKHSSAKLVAQFKKVLFVYHKNSDLKINSDSN